MNPEVLQQTAQDLMAEGRGILAIDESLATIGKRFELVNVESTPSSRRDYRQMLLTTPGLGDHISGAILFDETIRQSTDDDRRLVDIMEEAGIIPGIKVDKGAHDLAGHDGEKITEGLDGLRERLLEYRSLGARFAKWRAVLTIGDNMPTTGCVFANAHALARYASLCQENDLVPIVEPEVLMNGSHDLETCYEVTEAALRAVFTQLYEQNVMLEGTVLKASMVLPGDRCTEQASIEEVADATIQCLYNAVPAAVAGVVFLSGGQSEVLATEHLNAMNNMEEHPWPLSFSYGRALQHGALLAFGQNPRADNEKAQSILAHRARCNGLASIGQYERSMDR